MGHELVHHFITWHVRTPMRKTDGRLLGAARTCRHRTGAEIDAPCGVPAIKWVRVLVCVCACVWACGGVCGQACACMHAVHVQT